MLPRLLPMILLSGGFLTFVPEPAAACAPPESCIEQYTGGLPCGGILLNPIEVTPGLMDCVPVVGGCGARSVWFADSPFGPSCYKQCAGGYSGISASHGSGPDVPCTLEQGCMGGMVGYLVVITPAQTYHACFAIPSPANCTGGGGWSMRYEVADGNEGCVNDGGCYGWSGLVGVYHDRYEPGQEGCISIGSGCYGNPGAAAVYQGAASCSSVNQAPCPSPLPPATGWTVGLVVAGVPLCFGAEVDADPTCPVIQESYEVRYLGTQRGGCLVPS